MEASARLEPGWSLEDPGTRLVDQRSRLGDSGTRLGNQRARLADQMAVLNHRTRTNIHRAIQMSAGLLVVLVVVVCVATLATHTPNRGRAGNPHTSKHRLITNFKGSKARLPGSEAEKHKVMSESNASVIKRSSVGIEEVFISVKTASKFHYTRLPVILKTWYNLAKEHTFFFTDADDTSLRSVLGEGLVPTPCPPDHSRHALVCKMQHEFNAFLETKKKWFCHFDDDQYVNVAGLVWKLREFAAEEDWYLGKPSLEKPLEIIDRDGDVFKQNKLKFWFGTGGAGFCLSRPLAERMRGLAGRRQFISTSEKMRLPDDVTMGYIVEMLADVPLTPVAEFHSHLEPLALVRDLGDQISFSYGDHATNLVEVEGFTLTEDPTRFLSIHCNLNPDTAWCPKR